MAITKKRTSPIADAPDSKGSRRGSPNEPIPLPRLVPRGKTAFDTVDWKLHDAQIKNADGKVIFEQKGIRVPSTWSETSINIAASKYFRVISGRRENSVEGMIRRVCHWIADRGLELGYMDTSEEAAQFEESLSYLMVQQMAAFNSPVWFNVGVRICSAPPASSSPSPTTWNRSWPSRPAKVDCSRRQWHRSNFSALRGSHERLSCWRHRLRGRCRCAPCTPWRA